MANQVTFSSTRRARASSQRRNAYSRRFQRLSYSDVSRLCDVMETAVPIHGTGNFPTLMIRPSRLVELVQERLESIGVKVLDVRLNGSAATHVLCDDVSHTYKDLDFIFAIDFPNSNCEVFEKAVDGQNYAISATSSLVEKEVGEQELTVEACNEDCGDKCSSDDNWSVDDSGYTSSGSSGVSDTALPNCFSASKAVPTRNKKKMNRPRTHSLESASSGSTSFSYSRLLSEDSSYVSHHHLPNHQNWQEIKDVTMDILRDFLPEDVDTSRMNSMVLSCAYVQKMVKVSNETDRWSLISLNNNSGRNLDLKFVQNMKRQYEFSVDSFQIMLESYLLYRRAAADDDLGMSETFHPSVRAESVYGDFPAALQHLRQRRICTHRPEEIRGGGLLRYCNLLVRDYIPGSCNDTPSEIARLEKHMCARFFIDFSDSEQQYRKLVGYLDSHFQGENELKFQYLLVLRRVVDSSTVCLMQHERTMALQLIMSLIRQTLAQSVASHHSNVTQLPRVMCRECMRLSGKECADYRPAAPPPPAVYSCGAAAPKENGSCTYSPTTILHTSHVMYNPSSCGITYHLQDPNYASYRSRFGCCCCGSVHLTQSFQECRYTPNPLPSCCPTILQPIYYNSNNITCYYRPAGHPAPCM